MLEGRVVDVTYRVTKRLSRLVEQKFRGANLKAREGVLINIRGGPLIVAPVLIKGHNSPPPFLSKALKIFSVREQVAVRKEIGRYETSLCCSSSITL